MKKKAKDESSVGLVQPDKQTSQHFTPPNFGILKKINNFGQKQRKCLISNYKY